MQNTEIISNNIARGRLGRFETRLATSIEEVDRAQALRYEVFCQEHDALISHERERFKREADPHDGKCDHLLLLSNHETQASPDLSEPQTIIGTQRFLVHQGSVGATEFYSKDEFQISGLLSRFPNKRFMELGRSCILPAYRNKRTMELLWHGTWDYALKRDADVMFGCASFHCQDPEAISEALGFLAEHAPLSDEWMVDSEHPERIDMRQFINSESSHKHAIRTLPPLIKGYLRLGAMFSLDAVPDPDFGTIDVLVVLPLEMINPRYIKHYGPNADRHSA